MTAQPFAVIGDITLAEHQDGTVDGLRDGLPYGHAFPQILAKPQGEWFARLRGPEEVAVRFEAKEPALWWLVGPRRVQRRRAAGWEMPPNTVYVGRPGHWGNPFPVGKTVNYSGFEHVFVRDREHAVELYRRLVSLSPPEFFAEARAELRGRNLACWCPLDGIPCHADALLEVANERRAGCPHCDFSAPSFADLAEHIHQDHPGGLPHADI